MALQSRAEEKLQSADVVLCQNKGVITSRHVLRCVFVYCNALFFFDKRMLSCEFFEFQTTVLGC